MVEPTPQLRAAVDALPLFPLPEVVFLPHTLLPLHVFEPRYRQLVLDVMAGDGILGVPAWAGPAGETGLPPLLPICGVGRIVRHQSLPDGRSNIVLLGLGRVRLDEELPPDRPYRRWRSTLLPDEIGPGGDRALQRALGTLRLTLGQLRAGRPTLVHDLERVMNNDRSPSEFLHVLAHVLLQDPAERQAWLEEGTLVGRCDRALAALVQLLNPDGMDT